MNYRTITKMKALISSPYISSTFSPKSFPLISLPLLFNQVTCKISQKSPNFYQLKQSIMMSSLCSNPNSNNKPLQLPSGEIHVIVGPMFAGKSTALVHRVQSEITSGRNVAVIKSIKDTRYGLESVVTHDGDKFPCWPLAKLSSFKQMIGSDAYDKLEVIGIDEAQFFEDLYEFCSKVADYDGKTVIVAGLDGDYLRRKFGSVLDIIPIADSVTKLAAKCQICGKRASFTLRKTKETKTEYIAGADAYMAVCRRHYVSGQVVKEATVLVSQEVQCCSL